MVKISAKSRRESFFICFDTENGRELWGGSYARCVIRHMRANDFVFVYRDGDNVRRSIYQDRSIVRFHND